VRWVESDLYDSDWTNFAPTLGLAWDPFGDGKTSVRANFRVAYDRSNTFVFSSAIFNTAPGATAGVINSTFGTQPNEQGRLRFGLPTLAPTVTPEGLRQPPPFSNSSITVIDPSLRSPKVYQWGGSFQRELAFGSVLEVNYIGRKGIGLYGAYDVNQADIFNNGFLGAFNAVRTAFLASSACFPTATAGCGASLPANVSTLINNLLSSDTRRGTLSGSQFFANTFSSDISIGSVATAADGLARRLNVGDTVVPTIVRSGFSPFFFRPYPQFSGALNVVDSSDFSFYNALEVQVSRRFMQGLSYQLAYTFAKSMDTGHTLVRSRIHHGWPRYDANSR
jgi:hypothetical protein